MGAWHEPVLPRILGGANPTDRGGAGPTGTGRGSTGFRYRFRHVSHGRTCNAYAIDGTDQPGPARPRPAHRLDPELVWSGPTVA